MTENKGKWASRHRKIEKSGYQAAAKMISFPRRWHGGMISANQGAIWGMSVISINYMGVLNCTRAALEPMIKQGHGAIVSISSDASRQGEPREAVYGGMKAAVNSFMKTIAKENGRYGIRCNVVCPGVTVPEQDHEVGESSMWANKDAMFTPEQFEKIAASLPLKKVGRPGDIANAVTFLVSDAVAGHITGQVLSVSGGYSMVG